MQKLKLLEYWQKWEHSGSYRQDIFLKESFKIIEDKINEIIIYLNKKENCPACFDEKGNPK